MGDCNESFCVNCNEDCADKIGIRKDIELRTIHNGKNAVQRSQPEIRTSGLELDNIKLEIFRNRSEMEAQLTLKNTGEIVKRIPVTWKARDNKLDYLSVSKMSAYEQCPRCFFEQYMSDETVDEDGSNFYTKFGSILHSVVELAFKYYRDTGITVDPVSIYNDVWKSHNLTGFDAYEEGRGLILNYFSKNPVDQRPDDPLFIEHEWRGELGGTTFGLVIDYAGVFRDMPNIGLLKDYKTNRMPFTNADLHNSIQLRIYQLVLRRHLAPQIERWVSGYEMFFHDWQQCPEWTMDDLLVAEEYVANMWHQISNDNTWEETLNPYCGYRNCRFTCKTYRKFIENPGEFIDIIHMPEKTDIIEIDRQREIMASYEKIAKTRKDDCNTILKSAVEDAMKRGEKLVIDGKELSLYSNEIKSYRYHDVRNVLLINNRLDILDNCVSVNTYKLNRELNKVPELRQQLSGCIGIGYATPYIVKKQL